MLHSATTSMTGLHLISTVRSGCGTPLIANGMAFTPSGRPSMTTVVEPPGATMWSTPSTVKVASVSSPRFSRRIDTLPSNALHSFVTLTRGGRSHAISTLKDRS